MTYVLSLKVQFPSLRYGFNTSERVAVGGEVFIRSYLINPNRINIFPKKYLLKKKSRFQDQNKIQLGIEIKALLRMVRCFSK